MAERNKSSRCVPTLRSKFNFQSLPHEMWINVFEAMESSPDLLKVILTCKFFYSLALRVLYRDVHWIGPYRYTKNVSFWNRHAPSIALFPTSLTVTISLLDRNPFTRYNPTTAIIEEDGSWTVGPQEARQIAPCDAASRRIAFYASPPLYDAIMKRISSFVQLRDLLFHLSDLPDSFFSAIRLLPCLRHLSIQYCSLPAIRLEPDPSFSELPLTELTLWYNRGDLDTVQNSNYVYTLYLCTAKNLRTLRIDWMAVTSRFLSLQNPNAPIAPLTTLKEVMIRFPSTKSWQVEETNLYNDLFATFLLASPGIERFSCVNRTTDFKLPTMVMPNLKSYSGAMVPALELLDSRPVEHLELTDVDKNGPDVLSTLERVASLKPQLQSLCFTVPSWDEEVLYALSSMFVDLCKIQVKFGSGFLSEHTLLSLGARFLYKFPRLETLEIYKPTTFGSHQGDLIEALKNRLSRPDLVFVVGSVRCGPADDDGEVKRSLNAWKKPCPLLRQVRLTEKFVWRRSFNGDEWCKRPVATSAHLLRELY